MGQHSEVRVIWPIEVNGELIRHASYQFKAYPTRHRQGFRIILVVYDHAVCRIDFDIETFHYNSFDRPEDLIEYSVGPRHYHAWSDNARFATARTLPKELDNARDLPSSVRTFEQAQRWFCAENGIKLDHGQIMDLPSRGQLV